MVSPVVIIIILIVVCCSSSIAAGVGYYYFYNTTTTTTTTKAPASTTTTTKAPTGTAAATGTGTATASSGTGVAAVSSSSGLSNTSCASIGAAFTYPYADTLSGGQTLDACQGLQTTLYKLVMQSDGNLVLYNKTTGATMWATNTVRTGANSYRFSFQTDGNAVVYDKNNSVLWASGSTGKNGNKFVVQADGNMVMYNGTNAIWASNTRQSSTGCKIGLDPVYTALSSKDPVSWSEDNRQSAIKAINSLSGVRLDQLHAMSNSLLFNVINASCNTMKGDSSYSTACNGRNDANRNVAITILNNGSSIPVGKIQEMQSEDIYRFMCDL